MAFTDESDMKKALRILLIRFLSFSSAFQLHGAPGMVSAWGGGQTNFPAGLTNIISISTSTDHSLALHADGTVSAWGCDDDGECDVPTGLTNAIAVAAGDYFSLALLSNGTVVAWGTDDRGQCDIPANLNNVTAISAGHSHALAVQQNGTVMAWGWNSFGQTNVPSTVQNPKQIVAAGNNSMALLTNGTVEVWGVDDAGQTNVPANLTGVTDIAGAKGYCLAVSNGTVIAWGASPSVPPDLNNAMSVAAGLFHSLALLSSGAVTNWGANQSGEGLVPASLTNTAALAAGWSYSLALSGPSSTIIFPIAVTLTNATWSSNGFAISFQSQNGVAYTLQYTTALPPTNWNVAQTTNGPGGTLTLTDASPTDAQRFYRIQAQ